MKKTVALICLMSMLLTGILSGCAAKNNNNTDDITAGGSETVSDQGSTDNTYKPPNNNNNNKKDVVVLGKKPIEIIEIDFSDFGLQVDDDGVINLNGKPYYGMGVNFHPLFHLALDKQFANDTHTDLEKHFKRLSEEGIQVVRFNANIFYANQVYLWADSDANKELWLAGFDYIVALAEKYNIGLIPSLFWNVSTYIEYYNETMDAMIDPNSQSNKLRKEYVEAIVGRYKYSPAIYAWEIGNELNLAVDIKNTMFVGSDGVTKVLSSDYLTQYYTIVGNMIREEDPYRMITGGDAAPRDCSMALYESKGNSWSPKNDYADILQTFKWYTPDPLDCQSLHYTDHANIKNYVNAAKENKIALYVGEWYGDPNKFFQTNFGDKLKPEDSPEEAAEQATWYEERDLYIENGVQLVITWTYGSYSQNTAMDWASLELGVRDSYTNNYYMAEGIKEANTNYMNEGKNDSVSYWDSVSNTFLID